MRGGLAWHCLLLVISVQALAKRSAPIHETSPQDSLKNLGAQLNGDGPKGKSMLKYGGVRDLEVFDVQKLGQTVLGLLAGSAVGVVAGDASMGASGAQPDVQDGVGHLWAGAIGGALAGYQLNGGKDGAPLERSMSDRSATAQRGMANGMVAGLVGGAIAQVFSGSSDEGGSSASAGSSSSSSSKPNTDLGNDPAAIPVGGKGGLSLAMSGNMPILHNALAGALGGAAAGYLEPEILSLGGTVGKGARALTSKIGTSTADFVKGRKRDNMCVSTIKKATQVQKGEIDSTDDAMIMFCPEGFLIFTPEVVTKSVPSKDTLAKAKAYLEALDCDGQAACYAPACTSTKECVVPGCEFESEAKAGKVMFTYKCIKDPSGSIDPNVDLEGIQHTADVCVDTHMYDKLRDEQSSDRRMITSDPKTARVAHCGKGKVISHIQPSTTDYPGSSPSDKALVAEANDRFQQCNGQTDCFLEICEPLNCPVPGCEVNPSSKKVVVQRHFNYVCVNES